MTLTCPYCNNAAELTTGASVYPHRPDLREKPVYWCKPCDAWVGCHPGTTNPLGRLADAELRRAKQDVHALFDPMWKAKMRRDGWSKKKARGAAYAWLALELAINVKDCHIGMFDVETCRRAVTICSKIRQQRNAA